MSTWVMPPMANCSSSRRPSPLTPTCSQRQDAENALFATGVEARPLMAQAGRGCAEAIRQFFRRPVTPFCSSCRGHNGGDASVAGRWLRRCGWHVSVRGAFPVDELAPLTRTEWELFRAEPDGPTEVIPAHDHRHRRLARKSAPRGPLRAPSQRSGERLCTNCGLRGRGVRASISPPDWMATPAEPMRDTRTGRCASSLRYRA